MAKKDHYKVLGVREGADPQEIRRAFRQLAKRWHPDRNPDSPEAEERFREIVEAWRVLGDAGGRRHYDFETGRQPRPPEDEGPAPDETSVEDELTDAGWDVARGEPFVGRGPRVGGGCFGGDHEATCGCLLLLVALTSPMWAPLLIRLLWRIYDAIRYIVERA